MDIALRVFWMFVVVGVVLVVVAGILPFVMPEERADEMKVLLQYLKQCMAVTGIAGVLALIAFLPILRHKIPK